MRCIRWCAVYSYAGTLVRCIRVLVYYIYAGAQVIVQVKSSSANVYLAVVRTGVFEKD